MHGKGVPCWVSLLASQIEEMLDVVSCMLVTADGARDWMAGETRP